MSSGIEVSETIHNAINDLKLFKYGALVLKVSDDSKEIVLDKSFPASAGDPESEWKEIVSALSESECRYIFTDFKMKETPTVMKSKLILINWTPEYSPIRHKVIFSSSLVNVVTKAEPNKQVQATELSELDYKVLRDSVFSS